MSFHITTIGFLFFIISHNHQHQRLTAFNSVLTYRFFMVRINTIFSYLTYQFANHFVLVRLRRINYF